MWSPEGSQDSMQDLKFTKLTTNMATQGLLHKNLFPQHLVRCLWYLLFLPLRTSILQAISNEKHLLNKNCDVDVGIDRASYQSKNKYLKNWSSVPTFLMQKVFNSKSRMHLWNNIVKKTVERNFSNFLKQMFDIKWFSFKKLKIYWYILHWFMDETHWN